MAEKSGSGGKGLKFTNKKKHATGNSSSKHQAFEPENSPSTDDLFEIWSDDDEDLVDFMGTTSKGNPKTPKNTSQSSKRALLESRSKSPLEMPRSKAGQSTSKYAMNSGKEASWESGGNSPFKTPGSKGNWEKGGKAGGKGSLPHAIPIEPLIIEVEPELEMDLPANARVLMDYEAGAILQRIQGSLTVLAGDPNIKIPGSFKKAVQYCDEISTKYTNPEAARQVLDTLKTHGVTEGEICMIGNICPENETELYALVPSLKANRRKNEGPIKEALSKLAELKQS